MTQAKEPRAGDHATAHASLLPPLLLQALRVANTIDQGVHGRRRTGMGDSFWQFKPYHWGDDLRRIDWRQSAKTDKFFLRQTEWEAAQSAFIWCDLSPSMRYQSTNAFPMKHERAITLALAICHLLVRAGERVAFWDRACVPIWGQSAIDIFLTKIDSQLKAPAETEKRLPPYAALPTHAQAILISDFFVPLKDIARQIHYLAKRDIQGYLLQITDPAEETMPFFGRIRFLGLEDEGNILFSRTETIREDYLDRLYRHRDALKVMTRNIGWHFAAHHTDLTLLSALLPLYHALASSAGDHYGRNNARRQPEA